MSFSELVETNHVVDDMSPKKQSVVPFKVAIEFKFWGADKGRLTLDKARSEEAVLEDEAGPDEEEAADEADGRGGDEDYNEPDLESSSGSEASDDSSNNEDPFSDFSRISCHNVQIHITPDAGRMGHMCS